MNEHKWNFGPGPSYIVPEVYKNYLEEGYLKNGFNNSGFPIGSISHRSLLYLENVQKPLIAKIKSLLEVPDNYSIIITRDGASEQWSRIVRNFNFDKITYVITGDFAKRALSANDLLYGENAGNIIESDQKCTFIPISEKPPKNSFVHITWNNTVEGTEFSNKHLDFYSSNTLLIDATSNIFSRKINWEKHNIGMIYGSTTKNVGESGNCISIIRNDLLDIRSKFNLSNTDSYKVLVDKDSGLYTSNTSGQLLALKVLEYYESLGGVEEIQKLNKTKADLLYEVIDNSGGFYIGHSMEDSRSNMNVVFYLDDNELYSKFLDDAEKAGLFFLKGHSILPHSLRASIYNMMPIEGVKALADFMDKFIMEN